MKPTIKEVPLKCFGLLLAGIILLVLASSKKGEPADSAKTPTIRASKVPAPPIEDPENPELVLATAREDQRLVLALDHFVARDAEGKESVIALDPPATRALLLERIAQTAAGRPAFPVAYPPNAKDSLHARRLLTPDITVRLPEGQSAAELASKHGLALKSLPEYAPGFAIFTAADPLAAIEKASALKQLPEIALVEVQTARQRQRKTMPNDAQVPNMWHLKYQNQAGAVAGSDLNIEGAWRYGLTAGVKGTNLKIGIVDDGLQTAHPDFAGNVDTTIDKDWNGNDLDPNPVAADDTHGTCVAGITGARGNNAIGVCGTAPEADLVGMRLIAASTTDEEEAEAMTHRNDVIIAKNNSWGGYDTGDSMDGPGPLTEAAFATATTTGRGAKGTILVWSAGNGLEVADNSNFDGYVNSIYSLTITSASSQADETTYAEPGANVLVAAPSDDDPPALAITTTDRTGANGYSAGDYATDFGGTSAAAPAATGVVALMLHKNPNLGWRDVKEILVRTARKIDPTDADWRINDAGFSFNHKFGAGLIDATAAVNLAENWTNLTGMVSSTLTQSGLNVPIPNASSTGITRTFNVTEDMRVEHVVVKLNINHAARGDLYVRLISPGGMESVLATTRDDLNANYSNWKFSSVRHWGEHSEGAWTLQIFDLISLDFGALTLAELSLYGSNPPNPPPTVTLTAPTNNTTRVQGQTVTLSATASDLNWDGAAGTISKVQFFRNGLLFTTDTTFPYTFTYTPPVGVHEYSAKSFDAQLLSGAMSPVARVTVISEYDAWIAGFPGISDPSPTADVDKDGFTNVQEFAAKTSPVDARDFLRITGLSRSPAGTSITLTWASKSGVTYRVESSDTLSNWQPVGTLINATAATTTSVFSSTLKTKSYFRVVAYP